MDREKKELLFIVLFTILIRAVFYLMAIIKGINRLIPSDALYTYLPIAKNVFNIGRYSRMIFRPYTPDAFIPPLYPVLLGICRNIHLILIFQIIISDLFAIYIYKFGKMIFDERIGFYSALLFSISPGFIYYSLLPLPDFIFAFFLLLAIYYLLKKNFLVAGIMVGCGILSKPLGFLSLVLFFIFILYERNWKGILKFSIPIIILLTPWYIRNKITFHHFGYSALPAYALIYTNIPILEAYINHIPFTTRENDPVLDSITNKIKMKIPYSGNDMEMAKKWKSYARKEIVSHLGAYIKISIKGIIFTALGTNVKYLFSFIPRCRIEKTGVTTALMKGNIKEAFRRLWKNGIALILILLEIIIIGLLWICSIYALINFKKKSTGIMILVLLLITMFIPGPVGNGRFRLSIEPLLYIFGVEGLNSMMKFYVRC